MDLKRRLILVQIVTVTLLGSLLSPAVVIAKEPPPASKVASWTLPILVGSDTLRLSGYRPKVAFNLNLPPGWTASAAGQMTLDYRISQLTLEGATLTLRLNNQNLHSVAFEDEAGSLTLDLPADMLHPGQNIVEMAAFLPLEEDRQCIVPNHPARWLEFGPTSRIALPVEASQTAFALPDFPAQFETPGDENNAPVTFVIPAEPDDSELSALSAVAFALALGSETGPEWSVVPAHEFSPGSQAGPVVLIGAAGSNHHLEPLAPSGGHEFGWLRLMRPDWSGGEAVLAVSGPDGRTVLQAARALADPIARLQMSGETAVIEVLPAREPVPLTEQFTLADLGYSDRTARGPGEQSLIYAFDVPFAWSPGDGQLELRLAHAGTLDQQVAGLVVAINGSRAAGIRIDTPQGTSNVVEIPIPKDLIRPGRNFLRLTFDFGTPVDWCDGASAGELWATVHSDSVFTLPHGARGGRLNLNDFPYLFASEVDQAALVIVLPAESGLGDFREAMEMVRALAVTDIQIAPRWVKANASSLDEETKEAHLILLGDVSRQPVLSELNPYLHIPFDLASKALLPTYGIRLPVGAPDLGTIQALRSPWAENRLLLVVTGTNSAGYNRALRLLADPLLQSELAGQVALVAAGSDADHPNVYTQVVADVSRVPGVAGVDRAVSRLLGSNHLALSAIRLVTALLILVAVSVIGLLWYGWRTASGSGGD